MAIPPVSKKDAQQVIRHAFDDATGRFRVDANIDAQDITVEVALDATDDSVRVEDPDTSAHIRVESNGSINVNSEIDAGDGDNIAISDGTDTLAINADGSINIGSSALPVGAATEATLSTLLTEATFTASVNTLGQKAASASTPIVIASDQTPEVSSTATVTSINVANTSTVLLASNVNRKGASFYNDGGGSIYIKLGTGASATSFTVRTSDNTFYELPYPIYTGVIEAITASGTRSMRVTELT